MRNHLRIFVGVFVFLVFGDSILLRGQGAANQSRAVLCEPQKDLGEMCFNVVDPKPLGIRIPIILIHGWNRDGIPGEPKLSVWSGLNTYLQKFGWFNERYKLYYLSYYSNIQSIDEMGRILRDLVDRMGMIDSEFRRKPLVLIGYSMGGLIARAFMQEELLVGGRGQLGGERVLKLITLATPHHGTPIANGPARDHKGGALAWFFWQLYDNGLFNDFLTWSTHNRFDLHWDNYDGLFDYERYFENNLWLERLNADKSFHRKINAYGGVIAPSANVSCIVPNYPCLAAVMKSALGVQASDGVVPYDSAFFSLCSECAELHLFKDYDHDEMVRGKSDTDPLFRRIADDLYGALFVGRWFVNVSGHTYYGGRPITWIQLRLDEPLSAFSFLSAYLPPYPAVSLPPLSASWMDSAGCLAGVGAENPYIFGSVENQVVSIGVEHLYCNDDSDFYLRGIADKEFKVITGRCSSGGEPNCRFTMTRR